MKMSTQQFVTSQIKSLVNEIPLQQISLPIFNITYSLWRKNCYRKLLNISNPLQHQLTLINKEFFQVSQRQLLPQFINKLKHQLNKSQLGWKKAIEQQNQIKNADRQEYSQIILNYSQAIFMEQFFIELFKDLVSIPYLNFYPQKSTFQVNLRFLKSYYQKKNQKLIDKTFNKMGKSALTKGLNIFSESIITRSFLYKMTSLIGSFNPLIMITSLSIGSLIQNYDQKNRLDKMISQIKILTDQSKKNIQFLEEHYQKCLSCIQTFLNLPQKDINLQKKIKKQIGKVLQEDWLDIKQQQNGEWHVVTLKQKDSFQNLECEKSCQISLEQLDDDK